MAIEARYVGTYGTEPVVRRWTTTRSAARTWSRTGSSTSSGWRWRTCRRTTPSGGASRRVVRLLRAGHRHQPAADLPRVFERPHGCDQPGGLYRRDDNLDEHDDRRTPRAAANPNPISAAARPRRQPRRRGRAIAAGLPANFFVANPDVDDVNVTDSGAFSDYHALQLELRRRLSKGLSANVNYQYAHRARIRVRRLQLRADDGRAGERPSRHQDAVGLDDPGRPRPALRREHEPDPRGDRRRLVDQRRRPRPGAHVNLRQRPARRHDGRRVAGPL